jgi:hypothetical protein
MAEIVCPQCGLTDSDNSEGWRKVRACAACVRDAAIAAAKKRAEQLAADRCDHGTLSLCPQCSDLS